MHLLYLDDSGSAGNRNEEHLILDGFSVFERQIRWMTNELDQLAKRLYPAQPSSVEFHASGMLGGRSTPWKGMLKNDRRDAIKAVLKVLAESHRSTSPFACVVHKASFPGADPMELAFEILCNRFARKLKRLHAAGDTQCGLIILDNSSYETSLQRLARDFRSLGTRWGVLVNMAETPLFLDSRASRAIQLADHVAYAVFRRYEAGDASYFDLIVSRFDEDEGKIHGIVHKQTADPQCMCIACISRR